MSNNIVDRVFNEVCLDPRVSDGIFQMEEEQHMNALRDYFLKKGITKEAAIHVTNRMVEGRFPERQAYRVEDGILVTWPSPAHRTKAMKENPGKYTIQRPANAPKPAEPPAPVEKEPPPEKEEPEGEEDVPAKPSSNLFGGGGGSGSKIQQGNAELEIEPPMGTDTEAPKIPPVPAAAATTPPPAPQTPERIAAEKEVVKQIMATDDHALANITPPMTEECKRQLHELYNKADQLGFREAITFLMPFIKP
jgi:hypothetical protein